MCGPPGSPPPARTVPQPLASSLVSTNVLGQARRMPRERGPHRVYESTVRKEGTPVNGRPD